MARKIWWCEDCKQLVRACTGDFGFVWCDHCSGKDIHRLNRFERILYRALRRLVNIGAVPLNIFKGE